MSEKKENYYDSIYIRKEWISAPSKEGALVSTTTTTKLPLLESVESTIATYKDKIAILEDSLKKIKDINCQYKKGDIVFSKTTGPFLFKDVGIVADWMDTPTLSDASVAKAGQVYIHGVSLDGSVNLPVESVIPYTESVRLLYESERNKT